MASSVQPPGEHRKAGEQSLLGSCPAARRTSRSRPVTWRAARSRLGVHRQAPGIGGRADAAVRPGLNAITRAAASSMASGTPSRRWQMSTTARELLSLSAKSALTCRARSTNRLIASVCISRSMSSPGCTGLQRGKCKQSARRRSPVLHGWWPAPRRRGTSALCGSRAGPPSRAHARSCPAPAAVCF